VHRLEAHHLRDQELQCQEAGDHRQVVQQDHPLQVQGQNLPRHRDHLLVQSPGQGAEAGKKTLMIIIKKDMLNTCPFFIKFDAGENFNKGAHLFGTIFALN
jgi:hypothetical protein